jgi:hypothetical protein
LSNISLEDVIQITGGGNTLTILGEGADTVSVQDTLGATWSKSVGTGADAGFDIYTNSGDPSVTLRIESVVNDTIV